MTKDQYDKGRYDIEFAIGSQVLVYRPRGYIGQTTKLRFPWEGPFRVIEKQGDLNYKIQDERPGVRTENKMHLVHVTRLMKYHNREEMRELQQNNRLASQ